LWLSPHLLKIKNPKAPAVPREAEEDWDANRQWPCARAASGHAATEAAIPSMNARRRIAAPKAQGSAVIAGVV
jgi:hypothetical protein